MADPRSVDALKDGEVLPAGAELASSPRVEATREDEGAQLMNILETPPVLTVLHPLLREALKSDAARHLRNQRPRPSRQVIENPRLEAVLHRLNEQFERFYEIVKDPSRRLGPRMGKELMDSIAIEGPLLMECGVVYDVMLAFESFAMTTLRELLKQPSSTPFNPAEFEREQILQGIMNDLIAGPNRM